MSTPPDSLNAKRPLTPSSRSIRPSTAPMRDVLEASCSEALAAPAISKQYEKELADSPHRDSESLRKLVEAACKDLHRLEAAVHQLQAERHQLAQEANRANALERRLAIAVAMLGAIERSKHEPNDSQHPHPSRGDGRLRLFRR